MPEYEAKPKNFRSKNALAVYVRGALKGMPDTTFGVRQNPPDALGREVAAGAKDILFVTWTGDTSWNAVNTFLKGLNLTFNSRPVRFHLSRAEAETS